MRSQKGFTLMEVMVTSVIIALLAAIAIPSYRSYVQRGARANVESDLMRAVSNLERRKAQNFSYTGATAGTANTDTFSSISPIDATTGTQKYNVSLRLYKSDGTLVTTTSDIAVSYDVLAVSTNNFASGQAEALKINSLGQKCYKKLAASVTDCTIGTDPTWP